mmetsp:Transcript_47777/g.95388  ORF Transcript_47777/g.95388 Transcript_47777/m.95388 type:complete len:377 (-) Transcript_47777:159-1289(-)
MARSRMGPKPMRAEPLCLLLPHSRTSRLARAPRQGYLKEKAGSGLYSHFLGMFFGMAGATALHNVTSFAACRSHCEVLQAACGGFCFEGDQPQPATLAGPCYVMEAPHPNHMDMSNSNHCTGASSPSDCPFNLYRVSGDISRSWRSMLANLEYMTPFLGEGGVHPPYPQDSTIRSRPGGWAYPDMLEVGNLANATEDRSHFGAWVVISSPLILSFNLSDAARMDRVWPFITNKALLAVNQRWAGSPGRRLALTASTQVWAKPMGNAAHAVLLLCTGDTPATIVLPLRNISMELDGSQAALPQAARLDGDGGRAKARSKAATHVCVRDLYTGEELQPLPASGSLVADLLVHDSAFYCLRPSGADGGCEDLGGCPSGA